jgi:hypothetical protein
MTFPTHVMVLKILSFIKKPLGDTVTLKHLMYLHRVYQLCA